MSGNFISKVSGALALILLFSLPALAQNQPPTGPAAENKTDARPSIAILDLVCEQGLSPGITRLLNEMLLTEFQRSGKYSRVFGGSDLKAMLSLEQQKILTTGCSDESCLVEIGGALGVEHLAVANIGRIGSYYVINVKIIDVRSARVLSRSSTKVQGVEDALMDAVSVAVGEVTGVAPEQRRVVTATPPLPAPAPGAPPPPEAPPPPKKAPPKFHIHVFFTDGPMFLLNSRVGDVGAMSQIGIVIFWPNGFGLRLGSAGMFQSYLLGGAYLIGPDYTAKLGEDAGYFHAGLDVLLGGMGHPRTQMTVPSGLMAPVTAFASAFVVPIVIFTDTMVGATPHLTYTTPRVVGPLAFFVEANGSAFFSAGGVNLPDSPLFAISGTFGINLEAM